jgi:hypothetical protein
MSFSTLSSAIERSLQSSPVSFKNNPKLLKNGPRSHMLTDLHREPPIFIYISTTY